MMLETRSVISGQKGLVIRSEEIAEEEEIAGRKEEYGEMRRK
jgi:hypothetical protein